MTVYHVSASVAYTRILSIEVPAKRKKVGYIFAGAPALRMYRG